jgi:hypothetical protein
MSPEELAANDFLRELEALREHAERVLKRAQVVAKDVPDVVSEILDCEQAAAIARQEWWRRMDAVASTRAWTERDA